MKKRILLILLALVMIVSLVSFIACGGEEEPTPTTPTPTTPTPTTPTPTTPTPTPTTPAPPPWEWPEKLTVVDYGPGTAGYGISVAWTTELAKQTGMKVRIVAEESSALRFRWVQEGMMFNSPQTPALGQLYAQGEFATRDGGPFQSRNTWALGQSFMGYTALGDSGIKTPYDIKPGMKIIYGTFSPAVKTLLEAVLAWAQVDPEDVEWVPVGSVAGMMRALMDGRGDVTYGNPGTPDWYEAEAGPHGLTWLTLDAKEDPEGMQRYSEVWSAFSWGVCHGMCPTSEGIPMATKIATYSSYVGTDTDLVYHWVKFMDENKDKWKDVHPWAPYMTAEVMTELAESDFIPVHEGTIRYLKEKGLWTTAHEARNQLNIDNLTKWVDAYAAAIDLADEKEILVHPTNDEWMTLWEDYKNGLALPTLKMFTSFP
jgi:TRAP transporter TAXI family solute receptor